MTKFNRGLLLAAGLLVALPSYTQLGGGASQQIGGTIKAGLVTQAHGNVAGQLGVNKAKGLTKGQPVRPGMLFESDQDANTVLSFPDGQVGILGSKGQLRLNNYAYAPGDPTQGEINLNLIEGNLRVVMGEIAQVNPTALKLQVGTASVGLQPGTKSEATDASLVSLGGAVAVTVQEGLLEVRLPNGSVIKVGPGQTLLMDQSGEAQLDTTANMMQVLSQSALGQQIQAQLAESQGFTEAAKQAQTAMAPVTAALKNLPSTQSTTGEPNATGVQDPAIAQILASLDPLARDLLLSLIEATDEISQAQAVDANTVITPTTTAAAGGTPCAASCN